MERKKKVKKVLTSFNQIVLLLGRWLCVPFQFFLLLPLSCYR